MFDLIVSIILSVSINKHVAYPNKHNTKINEIVPICATYEDKRIVIWKKYAKKDRKKGFTKNTDEIPFYVN